MIFPRKKVFFASVTTFCAIGLCVFFKLTLPAVILFGVSLMAGFGFFCFLNNNSISQLPGENSCANTNSSPDRVVISSLSFKSERSKLVASNASMRTSSLKEKKGVRKHEYETDLMRAVKDKKVEYVKTALSGEAPCNFYARTSKKESALDYAIEVGSDEIVMLFLQKNSKFPFWSKNLSKIKNSPLQPNTKLLLYLSKTIKSLPVEKQSWWLQRLNILLEPAYSFNAPRRRRRDSDISGMKVAASALYQDQVLPQRRYSCG